MFREKAAGQDIERTSGTNKGDMSDKGVIKNEGSAKGTLNSAEALDLKISADIMPKH